MSHGIARVLSFAANDSDEDLITNGPSCQQSSIRETLFSISHVVTVLVMILTAKPFLNTGRSVQVSPW